MPEAKEQNEPSMEEILASIRRIIAEDGEGAAVPSPPDRPLLSPEDDILELTEMVEADGSVVSLAAKPPSPVAAPPEDAPPMTYEPPPETHAGSPGPEAAPDDKGLISPTIAAASVAALSQVVETGQRGKPPELPLGGTDRTLEDMVRGMLRPMLQNWLDQNLPHLVERLVSEEIARLAKEAQRR